MIEITSGFNSNFTIPSKYFGGHYKLLPTPIPDQELVINDCILQPGDCNRLSAKAKGKTKAVIIISDSTRGIPDELVLPPLIRKLKEGGLGPEQITIIVAVGLHRLATPEEVAKITAIAGGIKTISHNAYNDEEQVFLGYSSRKTPIYINRLVSNSDLLITIGKVEPHEFAGFTGGRKSVLPGVAGEKTINYNHRPETLEHPSSITGILEGNPIHEDAEEVASLVGVDYTIQLVLNGNGNILGAFSGKLKDAHKKAIDFCRKCFSVSLRQRPNIIVCNPGTALEINLYQSLKAVFAAGQIIASGGVIILDSHCEEGIGSDPMFEAFINQVSLDDVLKKVRSNYNAQADHAILLAKVLKRDIRVLGICPGVASKDLETLGIKGFSVIQKAIDESLRIISEPHIVVAEQIPTMNFDF